MSNDIFEDNHCDESMIPVGLMEFDLARDRAINAILYKRMMGEATPSEMRDYLEYLTLRISLRYGFEEETDDE
jgi:hypothetical protein